MKKRCIAMITAVLLLLTLVPITGFAATASATLTGPSTVRAGDTITLTFNLNGSGIYGASGALSYDSNQLTLTGTTQKVGNGWAVEFNGNNFVAYDNNLAKPINSNTAIFTASFKIKNVSTGTTIKVSCTGVSASDGVADISVGTVSYSATIAAPMSADNALKSLTVSNATISPAFSAGTTSYTAEVPFSVSKLELSAAANDSKAKVSINSPNLTPNGTTKVTVTVTAENGSTKTYTISVKRAQDPNYTASGNNDLSGISVDGFLLSPVFSAENTKYVIWLPYETESVTVSGTAADSKASVNVEGGSNLLAGQDNEIKVICTAENGTAKTYTVIAKRAAAHDGSVDEPTVTPDSTDTPEATEPSVAPTEPAAEKETETNDNTTPEKTGGISAGVLILAIVLSVALGFVLALVLLRVTNMKTRRH